ncbi:hypothetical protein OIU77_015045 [Salix suchowensis]|uniref:Uncharacterized protein n=1 Tax=Salix suchowensis TaxID=1278906 RepID=A0ABQ8ZZB4_9ROSI|nr:hypothetical protein OIU77_015045 [Salix suchowensis]
MNSEIPVTELAHGSQSQRHRFPSLSITDSISHDPNNLLKRKMHAIRQRNPIYHLINKPISETRRPRRKPPRRFIPVVTLRIYRNSTLSHRHHNRPLRHQTDHHHHHRRKTHTPLRNHRNPRQFAISAWSASAFGGECGGGFST